jgi:hypothetical protein
MEYRKSGTLAIAIAKRHLAIGMPGTWMQRKSAATRRDACDFTETRPPRPSVPAVREGFCQVCDHDDRSAFKRLKAGNGAAATWQCTRAGRTSANLVSRRTRNQPESQTRVGRGSIAKGHVAPRIGGGQSG